MHPSLYEFNGSIILRPDPAGEPGTKKENREVAVVSLMQDLSAARYAASQKREIDRKRKHEDLVKYRDEHNKDPNWFKHDKHVLIVTHAGRPIYTRFGSDDKMAAYMGVLSAIISNFSRIGDNVRCIVAGKQKFVFVMKGPLHMVCISKTNEATSQLVTLLEHVHAQILAVLTAGIHEHIDDNPSYDARNLLGDTTPMLMTNVISAWDRNPCYMLDCYECLRMPKAKRVKVTQLLKKYKDPSMLFSLVLAHDKVVSLVSHVKDRKFHPSDLLCLINLITNSSLQSSQKENWSPICLPHVEEQGYFYVYYSPLTNSSYEGSPTRFTDVCLILISTNPGTFAQLRKCKESISQGLSNENLVYSIEEHLYKGNYIVSELGTKVPELVHFLYKSIPSSRLCRPSFAGGPYSSKKSQLGLLRKYQHIYDRVTHTDRKGQHGLIGSRTLYFESSPSETMLAWVRPNEFLLIAVFSPLVSKDSAITGCNKTLRWVKREEHSLFAD